MPIHGNRVMKLKISIVPMSQDLAARPPRTGQCKFSNAKSSSDLRREKRPIIERWNGLYSQAQNPLHGNFHLARYQDYPTVARQPTFYPPRVGGHLIGSILVASVEPHNICDNVQVCERGDTTIDVSP